MLKAASGLPQGSFLGCLQIGLLVVAFNSSGVFA